MNNHNVFETIEYNIKFKNLIYCEDDKNDYKFVDKFIKRNNICKVIQKNYTTVIGLDYHQYYNHGKLLSRTVYYYSGKIICSFVENDENSQKIILTAIRKIKLIKLKLSL
jgi:hypothetical protein